MSKSSPKASILEHPILFDCLGLIFIIIFITMAPPLGSDPGIGWHLKTGQWILENQQIPNFDPFLWSTVGKEWISNQWLSDLIFWLIYKNGGWDALAVFCFTFPLVTMICLQGRIILPSGFRSNHNKPLLINLLFKLLPFSALALSLLVAWVQWISRPVIFSFVIFSVLFYWIWQQTNSAVVKSKLGFNIRIFVLFVLWANLHSAFPLGMLLLACASFSAVVEKKCDQAKLFIFGSAIALIATLINPYGYKLHANILALISEPYFMKLNNEWLSPNFSEPLFLPLVIAFAALLFRGEMKSGSPYWIRLVIAIFAVLALKAVRYTPFLGLILPAALTSSTQSVSNLESSVKQRKFFPILSLLSSLIVFLLALFSELPNAQSYSSKILLNEPMWHTLGAICQRKGGRIYNHPDLGGAITFKLNPACKAGIDDRNELNGVSAYKEFFDISKLENGVEIDKLANVLILECSSEIARAAKAGNGVFKINSEFERFCILERGENL